MPGVLRELAKHKLELNLSSKPVKQCLGRFSPNKKATIKKEITKLLAAEFIREIPHPDRLANPILVKKKNGKRRVCVDYTDLNKASLKDPFPFHGLTRWLTPSPAVRLSAFRMHTLGTTRSQ